MAENSFTGGCKECPSKLTRFFNKKDGKVTCFDLEGLRRMSIYNIANNCGLGESFERRETEKCDNPTILTDTTGATVFGPRS